MTQADFVEVEYRFEELRVFGEAVMAWGTATLTEDYQNGQHYGFYVSHIELDDGTVLKPANNFDGISPSPFKDSLFKAISKIIESDLYAQSVFDEAFQELEAA